MKKEDIVIKNIYKGDVVIKKENEQEWQEKLKNVTEITGYLSVYSNVTLKQWKILKKCKPKIFYLSNKCADYILDDVLKNAKYIINNVQFDSKELFDKIRKDQLTAEEVFKIENIEQRRIAYEFMDKIKMKELPNMTVLDEDVDKYNNQMKVISFTMSGYDIPFMFYQCICPSTKREYFVETKQKTCKAAKSMSFGLENIEFSEEW